MSRRTTILEQCEAAGARAYREGRSFDSYPIESGWSHSKKRDAWFRGWAKARRAVVGDIAIEPPRRRKRRKAEPCAA